MKNPILQKSKFGGTL